MGMLRSPVVRWGVWQGCIPLWVQCASCLQANELDHFNFDVAVAGIAEAASG